MPLRTDAAEAAQFGPTGPAPAPHADFLVAAGFRAAAAAQRLGLLSALDDTPRDAGHLAGVVDADPTAVGVLLDVLVAAHYAERDADGRYTAGPVTARWLGANGPYASVLTFWDDVLGELWSGLDSSTRDGKPGADFYPWLHGRPATLGAFQGMLTGLAGAVGEDVVRAAAIPDDRAVRLLDVGGGHARYSLAFTRRHPRLHAEVLDLPAALRAGETTLADAGEPGTRVALRSFDLDRDELATAGPADVVLLCNIVHGYSPDGMTALLRQAYDALAPGGRVVLLEPLADRASDTPGAGEAFVRVFSLNLLHTQGGRVFSTAEITESLRAAGFADPTVHPVAQSPTDHVLVGCAL